VGDVVNMRMRRSFNRIDVYDQIRARVVYVGSKSVVYEDVQSPRAGAMDGELRRVGEEFDTVQLPILEQNFASPLAMDAKLDNDGKVAMLFTKFVNDSLPGVIGYITSCNFYAPAQASASNQRELFYARVPRAGETAATWRYNLRSTVIHEVKHLTANAEYWENTAEDPEESWLEEGTAMHAEELYGRAVNGYVWKGNTTYGNGASGNVGLYCDGRPDFPVCSDRPRIMLDHFAWFYDFQTQNEALTMLQRKDDSDASFYGSTWAFVRWIIDSYEPSDAALLMPLVKAEDVRGVASIVARTGKSFEQLLGEYSLALALDDALSKLAALAIGFGAYVLHALVDIDWEFVAVTAPAMFVLGAVVGLGSVRRVRVPLPAAAGVAVAILYSLVAPYASSRLVDSVYSELAADRTPAALSAGRSARWLNPLSTDPLQALGDAEAATNDQAAALRWYRRAVSLQPENSSTWYALGSYEFFTGRYRAALHDLDRAYGLDPYGPAGRPGGLLDQARAKVLGG
jgi:tetratricopeptide (TPR) repeat protein